MKLESMDYLCCPACMNALSVISEKQTEIEVVEGTLECLACKKQFEIKGGLPNLTFPEVLEDSDLSNRTWHDQNAQRYDKANRQWARNCGIWECWLWESRVRRRLVDKLELKENASVLETGVGTGTNLLYVASQTGNQAPLHGMDISPGMLEVARQKMKTKTIQVELLQGNASYLPYGSAKFDVVFHVGSLNQFGDKKRAIEEMHRVAKPGAKILIGDEGLAPGKEKTLHGRWILKRDSLFAAKPPVDLVPTGVLDLRVYWALQGTTWVIEFRKEP